VSGTVRAGIPKPEPVLLRLRLIGRMEALTLANESVLPLGRKTRGLLAILALSGRRPVLRSKLAELLWSRRSEEQARASLRQEIHRLLDALSPIGVDVITVERHTLALKPALTSVDAERILNASRNQAEALPPIEGVLLDELTGTDPALDIWLEGERARLREHAIALFESGLRRQREVQGQLAAARQLLSLDELHEGAWRTQIQGQLSLGERGLARQTAERCLAAFSAHTGSLPGLETRRLLAELGIPDMLGADEAAAPQQSREGAAVLEEQRVEPADALTAGVPVFAPTTWPPPAARIATNGVGHGSIAGGSMTTRERFSASPLGLAVLTILPLIDLNGQPDPQSLALGLVEDLWAGLSLYGGLRLQHGSELVGSLAHGRDDAVLREHFGIDYVMDGTMQRTGGRVRVILRLTDIRNTGPGGGGQIVWAQRFDAGEGDALRLQDDITTQVCARLPWEIALAESRRMRRRPVAELDVQGLSMRALSHILRFDRVQSEEAVSLLMHARGLDPADPLPPVFLGLVQLLRDRQGWDRDARAGALEASAAALEREPMLNFGLAVRALVLVELEGQAELALSVLERGLERFPWTATLWAVAALALLQLGRLEEAERHFERAQSLYPIHPLNVLLDRSRILLPLLRGQTEAAAEAGLRLFGLQPNFVPNLVPYLAALGHLHRHAEAERMRECLFAVWPDPQPDELLARSGLLLPEHRAVVADGLRLAGIGG